MPRRTARGQQTRAVGVSGHGHGALGNVDAMTRSTRQALAVAALTLGGALLIAGLIAGSTTVYDSRTGTSCGTSFDDQSDVAELYGAMTGLAVDGCDAAIAGQQSLTRMLIIPGALLLLVGIGAILVELDSRHVAKFHANADTKRVTTALD